MSKLLSKRAALSIVFVVAATATTGCSDDAATLDPIDRTGSPIDTAPPGHDQPVHVDAGTADASPIATPVVEHDAAVPHEDSDAGEDHHGGGDHDGGDNSGHDDGEPDAGPPPVVADGTLASVYSAVSTNCVSCHGAGKALDFSTIETVYSSLVYVPAAMKACAATDGGAVWLRVVPGDLEQSLIIQKLEGHAPCGNQMPIKVLLPDETVEVFRAWVAAGAPAL